MGMTLKQKVYRLKCQQKVIRVMEKQIRRDSPR